MKIEKLNSTLEALHPKGEWLRWAAPRAWDAMRVVASAIRRRPRVALYAAVVAVLVLPLVPDSFYAIPWPYRKAAGFAAFLAFSCLCLGRLLLVRAGDDLPPEDDVRSARLLTLLLPLACLALAVPLLRHPENLGFGDWDWFLQKHEAARRTIALWGQFPWWDPWCRGGFPLAANPQCGVISVAMPLILAFGTSVGMRLATLVCFLLACEGARRLAMMWTADPYAAVAAGLIYGLNGGVLVASVAAYHLTMCYCALPWLIYYTFRLGRGTSDALWLGFWLAFNILNGIQYFSVYAVMIVSVLWSRAALVREGRLRSRFLMHTALALGTFLALAGWRLATTGLVYGDFPRHLPSGQDESFWTIRTHLLDRPTAARLGREVMPYFWETSLYIGPVVVVLALASLAWGWRWWHTLAFLCGWLAAGSVSWYHPSYWLQHAPLFATMHAVTRWRFMAMLGIALAVATTLARWRASPRPALRYFAVAMLLIIGADYLTLGYQILGVAFSIAPTEDRFPGPPPTDFVQVRSALGFPAVLRGYGVIHGYEPLMGYDRTAPTERLWRGHPAYVGESWTARGPVEPVLWSPNRIVFQVEPNQEITINQNPGSWWLANGEPAMPAARCAEMLRPFVARADSRGRLELRIRPRGLGLALGMHLAGVALMLLAVAGSRALPAGEWRAAPT